MTIVGIIEEQHPERARLFMQWKQMNWPIMVDALNLFQVQAIPITIFIDENGIVRRVNPSLQKAEEELQKFLSLETVATHEVEKSEISEHFKIESTPAQEAINLFLWENPQKLNAVISLFSKSIEEEKNSGLTYFRLGVAYRSRFDSKYKNNLDFESAIENWQKALDIDPNQYIWRRRIQQYGPRLDKPYPFYDWVTEARNKIRKRGEIPVELAVEPGGAEFAHPLRTFTSDSMVYEEPDPQGKILRDEDEFIHIETVVVSSTSKKKKTARVHITFLPKEDRKAHWNNEVENLKLWINLPANWKTTSQYLEINNPPETVSKEIRKLEFEVQWPETEQVNTGQIRAYALYYVCEDITGSCLYRRQDIPITIKTN